MRKILLAFCALLFLGNQSAQAVIVIDQFYTPTITGSTSQVAGISTAPVLQEFTPTLSSVDFVRVGVRNFDTVSQALQLDIWAVDSGTHLKTGVSLGTTNATVVPLFNSLSSGLIQFNLPSSVSLTPGTLYGFEINRTVIQAMNFYADTTGYAGGILNFQGQLPGFDLIFQEGTNIAAVATPAPEPSSLILCCLAAAGVYLRRSGRKS